MRSRLFLGSCLCVALSPLLMGMAHAATYQAQTASHETFYTESPCVEAGFTEYGACSILVGTAVESDFSLPVFSPSKSIPGGYAFLYRLSVNRDHPIKVSFHEKAGQTVDWAGNPQSYTLADGTPFQQFAFASSKGGPWKMSVTQTEPEKYLAAGTPGNTDAATFVMPDPGSGDDSVGWNSVSKSIQSSVSVNGGMFDVELNGDTPPLDGVVQSFTAIQYIFVTREATLDFSGLLGQSYSWSGNKPPSQAHLAEGARLTLYAQTEDGGKTWHNIVLQ